MKVKKIGEIPKPPEPELEKGNIDNLDKIQKLESVETVIIPKNENHGIQKYPSPDSPVKNIYYIIGGIIFILLLFVLIYFLFLNNDTPSNLNSNVSNKDSVNKELALKEKELDIKEKELKQNLDKSKPPNYDEASNQINKWINFLGQQDFNSAYNMLSPNIRGSYSKFSSKKSYGGITKTTVFSCETVYSSGCIFEVIAEYESIDPYNRNGKFKQKFFINNCDGYWVISKKDNLSIEYYN